MLKVLEWRGFLVEGIDGKCREVLRREDRLSCE